jgi:hypothetical protein
MFVSTHALLQQATAMERECLFSWISKPPPFYETLGYITVKLAVF